MEKGYFQIYTGNGKGKTTAALGLALRAAGAGLRIYIGQFIKSMEYAEIGVLRERFPEVTVELYGDKGCIAGRDADDTDAEAVKVGFVHAEQALQSGDYDVVILDEIGIAFYFHLLTQEQGLALAEAKAPGTELIMTGRYIPDYLIDRADLVTEMKEIKHYYQKGVEARDGIER